MSMNRIAQGLLAPIAIFALLGTASAADIQGKQITLPSSERQVHVTQFKAPGTAPRPSVLLLHGAGGFDRRHRLVRDLLEARVAVTTFECRHSSAGKVRGGASTRPGDPQERDRDRSHLCM